MWPLLASAHARVHGIEDGQTTDIRYFSDRDRITEIQNSIIGICECRPRRQPLAVWVARSCEVGPVPGHCFRHFAIRFAPLPRCLVQMIEYVPEFGKMACAPPCVQRIGR